MGKVGRPLSHLRDDATQFIATRRLWILVADRCGITPTAVRLWSKVPPLRVTTVARAIRQTRHFVRPDLYEVSDG